jgi:hypothetical protein
MSIDSDGVSENAGLLGVTNMGSRRVTQVAAGFLIFFSLFGGVFLHHHHFSRVFPTDSSKPAFCNCMHHFPLDFSLAHKPAL